MYATCPRHQRGWRPSAQIYCATLNIPHSTHDLIIPFTMEDNYEVGRRSTIAYLWLGRIEDELILAATRPGF
nr:hypothetical protein [Tanacetum cinerariifolium]